MTAPDGVDWGGRTAADPPDDAQPLDQLLAETLDLIDQAVARVADEDVEGQLRQVLAAARPPARGDRIELVWTDDPHTRLTPGDRGTVSLVDTAGTVHVQWDSGSTLGLIPDVDRFTLLPPEGPAQ